MFLSCQNSSVGRYKDILVIGNEEVFWQNRPGHWKLGWEAVRTQCPLRVISRRTTVPSKMSAFRSKADVNHSPAEGPLLAEAVEKLLKNPFSAEIGEHCQIAEFLSY
jgi:hypothetical protein